LWYQKTTRKWGGRSPRGTSGVGCQTRINDAIAVKKHALQKWLRGKIKDKAMQPTKKKKGKVYLTPEEKGGRIFGNKVSLPEKRQKVKRVKSSGRR